MDIRKRTISEKEFLDEYISEQACVGGFRYFGDEYVRINKYDGYSDGAHWEWQHERFCNPMVDYSLPARPATKPMLIDSYVKDKLTTQKLPKKQRWKLLLLKGVFM